MINLRQRAKPERRLATVLFTDIVRSTELLSEMGDVRWSRLISEHHAIVRRALRRYGGKELDTAGDGFLAEFPRPLPAIECALDVIRELKAHGIEIRSGVHMGEVEVIGPKLGGLAVHIGARIAAKAEAGEVLVSGTVRDLVAGADLLFADRGEHELKGVPGAWRLYVVRPRVHAAEPAAATLPKGAQRPGGFTRRQTAAVAGMLVLLVTVGFVGVRFLAGATAAPPSLHANQIGRLDPASGRLLAVIPIGGKPTAVTSGGGYIWTINAADQTLDQIDPKSNTVVHSRSVNGAPAGLAFGAGSAWVSVDYGAGGEQGSVLRFAPDGNGISAVVPLSNGLGATAFGFGALWVANHDDGTVSRIDPDTNGVAGVTRGISDPEAIVTDGSAVWVADTLDSAIYRLDPRSGEIAAKVPLLAHPDALAAGGGAIWAVSSTGNLLMRLDPASNSESATLSLQGGPAAVAYGSGTVWVAQATSGTVVRVGASSNHVLGGELHVSGAPSGAYAGPDGVWVTVQQS